jgi:hypothetical protein
MVVDTGMPLLLLFPVLRLAFVCFVLFVCLFVFFFLVSYDFSRVGLLTSHIHGRRRNAGEIHINDSLGSPSSQSIAIERLSDVWR